MSLLALLALALPFQVHALECTGNIHLTENAVTYLQAPVLVIDEERKLPFMAFYPIGAELAHGLCQACGLGEKGLANFSRGPAGTYAVLNSKGQLELISEQSGPFHKVESLTCRWE